MANFVDPDDPVTPAVLREFASAEARRQGVDPGHILPLFRQESRFNAAARGPVTRTGERAIGPAQLMPGTAAELGVNPEDPFDNIRGGITYYKQQLERFKDPAIARAAYNAGPGAIEKYGGVPPFAETRDYVAKTQPVQSAFVDPDEQQAAATPATSRPQEAPPEQSRSFGQEALRQIGLTARAGITGVTGLGQMLADAPVQIANLAGANLPLPSREQQQLLSRLGLPEPETKTEKVAGAAATIAAGIMDPVTRAVQLASGKGVPEGFKSAKALTPGTEKREVLKAAQKEGFVVPPTQAEAKFGSRVLEGVGGTQRVTTMAQERNQAVADRLARRALRMPEDAPLNYEATKNVVDDAFERGYRPIMDYGTMRAGKVFRRDLEIAFDKFHGANTSFPEAVEPDVARLIDGYRRTTTFDSGDALDAIRRLREGATAARRSNPPNNSLANARLAVSKALEDEIERNLVNGAVRAGKPGSELLANYREARKTIAVAKTVEDVLIEGTGSVDALKLAAKLKAPGKGVPMTGDLREIAQFAKAFPKAAGRPLGGKPPPFSMPEQFLMGFGGPAALMVNPYAGLLGAIPPARLAARNLITNPAYQRAFVQPAAPPRVLSPTLSRGFPATYPLFSED